MFESNGQYFSENKHIQNANRNALVTGKNAFGKLTNGSDAAAAMLVCQTE